MEKKLPANAGGTGLIPGSGRSPGGGHSNQLQYSCLENPMDRGAWKAIVHEITESGTTKQPPPPVNINMVKRQTIYQCFHTNSFDLIHSSKMDPQGPCFQNQ